MKVVKSLTNENKQVFNIFSRKFSYSLVSTTEAPALEAVGSALALQAENVKQYRYKIVNEVSIL